MHNIVCVCFRVSIGVAVVWFSYNSAFFKPNLGLNNRHGDGCGLFHKVLAFSSRHGDGDNLILRGDFFACNSDFVVCARFNRHICGIAAWYANFAATWGDCLIIKFVFKVGWSGVAVNQFYVVWSDYQCWSGLMDFTIDNAGVDTVCEFKVFGVCKGECCGDVWLARVCICICAGCRNGCLGAGWRNREVRVFNKRFIKIDCAIICFFNIIACCRNGDLRLGDCGGYIRHFKCVVTGICTAERITRKGDCVCAGIGACKCCGYTRSVECAIIASNHTGDCAVVRNGYYIVVCVIHFIVNCWFIVFIPTNLQSRDACSGNRGQLAAKVVCAGNHNADCATNHNGFVKKICAGDIQCAACDRRKVFKLIWTTCIVKLPFVCIGCLRNSVCNWCGKPAAIHCITGDGCRAGDGHGFNHDCHVCILVWAIVIRRCTNGDCVRPSSAWRATNGISSVDNLKAVVCIICVRVYWCAAKLSGNDWICECAFGVIIIFGNKRCACIGGVVCGFLQRFANKVYAFFGPFCIKGYRCILSACKVCYALHIIIYLVSISTFCPARKGVSSFGKAVFRQVFGNAIGVVWTCGCAGAGVCIVCNCVGVCLPLRGQGCIAIHAVANAFVFRIGCILFPIARCDCHFPVLECITGFGWFFKCNKGVFNIKFHFHGLIACAVVKVICQGVLQKRRCCPQCCGLGNCHSCACVLGIGNCAVNTCNHFPITEAVTICRCCFNRGSLAWKVHCTIVFAICGHFTYAVYFCKGEGVVGYCCIAGSGCLLRDLHRDCLICIYKVWIWKSCAGCVMRGGINIVGAHWHSTEHCLSICGFIGGVFFLAVLIKCNNHAAVFVISVVKFDIHGCNVGFPVKIKR